ncbi:beta-lactamase-like protein [Pseudohyphozyma bogoriensis]|nr:beta-lactamase-like protein [Pseudohyphozyma bogoriensis]
MAEDLSKPVDQLTIRFATLPSGFQDETPQQLQNNPPVDTALTGLPYIDLDNYCCGAHGLGLAITTIIDEEEHNIMFDCGPESRSILRNVAALKIPMAKIERIVLSHWHADHSNGIPEALRLVREAQLASCGTATPIPVDLHPARPIARGSAPAPHFRTVARQPNSPTYQELEAAGGVPELHKEPHAVSNGALVRDERYLVIDVKGKGLVVISACSHAGIVNVVMDAVNHFKKPVHMVIGGLHLGGRDMEYRIQSTVDYFANELSPRAEYILPLHCSGFKAKMALTSALGDSCVAGGVGMRIVVDGDQ